MNRAFLRVAVLFLVCSCHAALLAGSSLHLIQPNGRESLAIGTVYPIRWEGTGPGSRVRLEYSVDNGAAWKLIADHVTGNQYDWTVPAFAGNGYLVRVALDTQSEPLVLSGHTGFVNYGVYSSDGRRVVTASDDGTARIWNAETGTLERIISGHAQDVMDVAFTPDCNFVATASLDRTAKLWNATTGALQFTMEHGAQLLSIAVSPDGSLIATSGIDGTIKIWNSRSGMLIRGLVGHTDRVDNLDFCYAGVDRYRAVIADNGDSYITSGKLLSASGDGTVKLWNLQDGSVIRTYSGPEGQLLSAQFSPDGTMFVAGGKDNVARVWDVESGTILQTFVGHTNWVWRGMFSSDQKYIATGSRDGTARLWDRTSGKAIRVFPDHASQIGSAVFSPDDSHLLTVGEDQLARIWSLEDAVPASDVSDGVWSVTTPAFRVVQPNGGETLVTGATAIVRWEGSLPNENVQLEYTTDGGQTWVLITGAARGSEYAWKVPDALSQHCLIRASRTSNREVLTLTGHSGYINAGKFSPDGQLAVTASDDRTAKIWDAATGTLVRTLTGHSGDVMWAEFSPDGNRIVTASMDKTAKIWNVFTGLVMVTLSGHTQGLNYTSFSPDGSKVVTSSEDGTARVWNVETGMPERTLMSHTNGIFSALYSADGSRIITASRDWTVKEWSAADGSLIRTLTGHQNVVTHASYSPNQDKILTTSFDNTARIWDATSGTELQTLQAHSDWVWRASFSPDETQVATGSRDGTAIVWNASAGTVDRILEGHAGDVGVADFNSDGKRILTAANDKLGKIWNIGPTVGENDVSDNYWSIVSFPSSVADDDRVTIAGVGIVSSVPNPATANVAVEYTVSGTKSVTLYVTDLMGRAVHTAVLGEKHSGNHTALLDVSRLTSGLYSLILQTESGNSVRAITIVR